MPLCSRELHSVHSDGLDRDFIQNLKVSKNSRAESPDNQGFAFLIEGAFHNLHFCINVSQIGDSDC